MVKVTIEFDGGAEVFTGDAVSCVVLTNEPDGTRSCSMLKGAFRRSFPRILADTCFSQVKASQKNHSPLDQLEALAAGHPGTDLCAGGGSPVWAVLPHGPSPERPEVILPETVS